LSLLVKGSERLKLIRECVAAGEVQPAPLHLDEISLKPVRVAMHHLTRDQWIAANIAKLSELLGRPQY
jgi:hypothetical protein